MKFFKRFNKNLLKIKTNKIEPKKLSLLGSVLFIALILLETIGLDSPNWNKYVKNFSSDIVIEGLFNKYNYDSSINIIESNEKNINSIEISIPSLRNYKLRFNKKNNRSTILNFSKKIRRKLKLKNLYKKQYIKNKDYREDLKKRAKRRKQVQYFPQFIEENSPIYSYTIKFTDPFNIENDQSLLKTSSAKQKVSRKIKIDFLYPGIRLTKIDENEISESKKPISPKEKILNSHKPLKERTQTIFGLPKLKKENSEEKIISEFFIPPERKQKESKEDYLFRIHNAVLEQADIEYQCLLRNGFSIDELASLNCLNVE